MRYSVYSGQPTKNLLSIMSVHRLLQYDWLLLVVLEQLSMNHAREEIKRTAASVVWMLKYYSTSRISSPIASASAAGISDLFSSSLVLLLV